MTYFWLYIPLLYVVFTVIDICSRRKPDWLMNIVVSVIVYFVLVTLNK
jgi:hypothetical protein